MVGMANTKLTTKLPGLKPLIGDRNMSAVARAIDMDATYFNQIVNCNKGVSLAMALRIGEYFEVPVEVLAKEPAVAQVA